MNCFHRLPFVGGGLVTYVSAQKRMTVFSSHPFPISGKINKEKGGEEKMADTAYCVRCKEKREMKDAQQVMMKNGKPALKGQCVVCSTKMTRILPAQKA